MALQSLSPHLNSGWKIVLKTFIVRTPGAVGEIVRVQTEHCHGDPVHGMWANFGEVKSPTEVCGVESEGVLDLSHTRGEQSV